VDMHVVGTLVTYWYVSKMVRFSGDGQAGDVLWDNLLDFQSQAAMTP